MVQHQTAKIIVAGLLYMQHGRKEIVTRLSRAYYSVLIQALIARVVMAGFRCLRCREISEKAIMILSGYCSNTAQTPIDQTVMA